MNVRKENRYQKYWDLLKDRYEMIKILGEGSFGQVMRARCQKTGGFVAIKLIKNVGADKQSTKDVLREI